MALERSERRVGRQAEAGPRKRWYEIGGRSREPPAAEGSNDGPTRSVENSVPTADGRHQWIRVLIPLGPVGGQARSRSERLGCPRGTAASTGSAASRRPGAHMAGRPGRTAKRRTAPITLSSAAKRSMDVREALPPSDLVAEDIMSAKEKAERHRQWDEGVAPSRWWPRVSPSH